VRVVVVGASGLIGAAVSARLVTEGHQVVGLSRYPPRVGLPGVAHVRFDVAEASSSESWLPLLRGVGAVVNCAGTLQDSPGDSTESVHHTGIKSLFAACENANVRRVVHLSAINVERKTSAFSESSNH
jgi:uncharacterized protein YbjT (DUF2867 family)